VTDDLKMPDGWPEVPMGAEHLTRMASRLTSLVSHGEAVEAMLRGQYDAGHTFSGRELVTHIGMLNTAVGELALYLGALIAEQATRLTPPSERPPSAT
jgi:hypothetical protein